MLVIFKAKMSNYSKMLIETSKDSNKMFRNKLSFEVVIQYILILKLRFSAKTTRGNKRFSTQDYDVCIYSRLYF